jgi:hypothetical protein
MAKYYNDGDSSSESSNFNEAALQIQRLHNSWLNCKKYRVSGDLVNWRWELESIWSELSSDARRLYSGVDWCDNKFNLVVSAIDKMLRISFVNRSNVKVYDLLDRKEKYLRMLQDLSGKGGSYRDGGEDLD